MKTVLLIDDDPTLRRAFALCLEQARWKVLEADTGDRGLALAFQHRPDVVLVDLLMPGTNGFQVCRALREQKERLPNILILVATGSGYAADRNTALESGADDYLIKPIVPSELLLLLDRLVGERLSSLDASQPARTERDFLSTQTRLKFWGVRGSVPAPGRHTLYYGGNTSCLEVRAAGEIIILDAGTGIRPLGLALQEEFKDQPIELTLLITHTHWDHIQGFPFFLPAYNPKNKIRILGYEGAREGLKNTLLGQMASPYFPISMKQMPSHMAICELKEMTFSIGPVAARAEFLNHPGICTGYRLFTPGGSITYMPDVELYTRLRAQIRNTDLPAEEKDFARDQDQKLIDFVRGSEVLVLDAQYDAAEYESHAGWGHSCLEDSVGLAIAGGVKRLFLFHHDPERSDEGVDRLVARARELVSQSGSSLQVEAAREGLELTLSPVAAGA